MYDEITKSEAALAWAQGKRVEACPRVKDGPWLPVKPHSSFGGQWSVEVLLDLSFKFRLASEPPAKRYRPWTPEEVPVGALLKARSWVVGNTAIIASVWDGKLTWVAGYSGHMECPLGMACGLEWNYSTDQGKTWAICGVEVES